MPVGQRHRRVARPHLGDAHPQRRYRLRRGGVDIAEGVDRGDELRLVAGQRFLRRVDEAVDGPVTAADQGDAEGPAVGAGNRESRVQPVDLAFAHRLDIAAADRILLQVPDKAGARGNLDPVEPHDRPARREADDRVRRVLHAIAFRHGEGDAQPRMQEGASAHVSLGRVVAVENALDGGKITRLVALAAVGGQEGACVPLRGGDAFGRRGMGGGEIDAIGIVVAVHHARIQRRLPLQRGQEGDRRARVVARLGHDPDADGIGFEFLLARELRHLRAREVDGFLAAAGTARHVGDDLADGAGGNDLLLTLQRVAGIDMGHLVRDDGGELGLVVGQGQQPAGDVDVPAGKRKGVDGRRVQQRDLVPALAGSGVLRQPRRDAAHVGIQVTACIGTPESSQNARIFPRPDPRLVALAVGAGEETGVVRIQRRATRNQRRGGQNSGRAGGEPGANACLLAAVQALPADSPVTSCGR